MDMTWGGVDVRREEGASLGPSLVNGERSCRNSVYRFTTLAVAKTVSGPSVSTLLSDTCPRCLTRHQAFQYLVGLLYLGQSNNGRGTSKGRADATIFGCRCQQNTLLVGLIEYRPRSGGEWQYLGRLSLSCIHRSQQHTLCRVSYV